MNINLTVEMTNKENQITYKQFDYDYESTKARFVEKMAKEVQEQMGHNVPADEMEKMLKASHSQAIFDFAVCSDWVLEHITQIAQELKSEATDSYKVISFEMVEEGISQVKYDESNSELKEMMVHMNRDFDTMIKEA